MTKKIYVKIKDLKTRISTIREITSKKKIAELHMRKMLTDLGKSASMLGIWFGSQIHWDENGNAVSIDVYWGQSGKPTHKIYTETESD